MHDDESPDAQGAAAFSRVFDIEPELSQEILSRSRRNHQIFLQKIDDMTATKVAEAIGVHETTISRLKKNPAVVMAMHVMALAGMKIVPVDAIVYTQPDEYK